MAPEAAIATRLENLAERIAGALDDAFDPGTGFGETEFYGTAFACLLWSRWPDRFGDRLTVGLTRLKDQDKSAPIGLWENPFHWEFVRFALSDLFRRGPAGPFQSSRDVLPEPGWVLNRVANWTLLRSTVRITDGHRLLGRFERWLALMAYQMPDGFIEDQRGRPTQQYHAFATALLGYQITVLGEPSEFLKTRFRKALRALVDTALFDGEVNAAGRGRFQSFGYAAAALALATGLRLGLAPEGSAALLRSLTTRLEAAIGEDGILPLVITRIDEQAIVEPPPHHEHQSRIGWHSYNNRPDYLAFSGAMLVLAAEQLSGLVPEADDTALPSFDGLTDKLRTVRNQTYSAITTLPNNVLAAAQPLPYIVLPDGRRPLPSHGGEDLPESIHTALAMPIPVFETADGWFEDILPGMAFRWAGPDRIVGETASMRFERRFRFEEKRIQVEDALTLSQPREAAHLHLPWLTLASETDSSGESFALDGARLIPEVPLHPVPEAGPLYGTSGPLRAWSARVEPPAPGEVATARYEILF